jgi:hypothetical protein
MLKLFVPALVGFALLAPAAQAQPSSALRSATVEISRDAGFELVATAKNKKKPAKKPAVKKMSSPKKATKASRPVA